jgi:hypothetical protein
MDHETLEETFHPADESLSREPKRATVKQATIATSIFAFIFTAVFGFLLEMSVLGMVLLFLFFTVPFIVLTAVSQAPVQRSFPRTISVRDGLVTFTTPSTTSEFNLQDCRWFIGKIGTDSDLASLMLERSARKRRAVLLVSSGYSTDLAYACGLTSEMQRWWEGFLTIAGIPQPHLTHWLVKTARFFAFLAFWIAAALTLAEAADWLRGDQVLGIRLKFSLSIMGAWFASWFVGVLNDPTGPDQGCFENWAYYPLCAGLSVLFAWRFFLDLPGNQLLTAMLIHAFAGYLGASLLKQFALRHARWHSKQPANNLCGRSLDS